MHDRIREQMVQVYRDSGLPSYLNDSAKSLLVEGRQTFDRMQLATNSIIQDGREILVFPWAGDRVLNTMALALRQQGLQADRDGCALVVVDRDTDQLRKLFTRLAAVSPPDPLDLANLVENLQMQKHHRFLSRPLLLADYASSQLDVPGAWAAIARLAAE